MRLEPGIDAGEASDVQASADHLRDPARDARLVGIVIGLIALTALGIQFFTLLRPGYLRGVTEYDDGVYIAAATRMVHGALPYRNFAFVEPPGVPLLLTPIALLGRLTGIRQALEIARIFTAVVTAVNVVLLGVLLRRRNLTTIFVACGVLAAYPSAIDTGRTLLLEPYLVLFCLAGLITIFDGDRIAGPQRWFAGGLVFGCAATMKVWAILPVLALVLACLPYLRSRIRPLMVGLVAGFVVPCFPFFIADPRAFVRDVVGVQLERIEPQRVATSTRLAYLTGIWGTTLHLNSGEIYATTVVMVVAIAACFGARRTRLSPLDRFAVASVVVVSVAMLWPDEFYYHYATFLGPFLALTFGIAAGRVADALQRFEPVVFVIALTLGGLLIFNGVSFAARQTDTPASDPAATIDAIIPAGACVVTDTTAYLVNANRFGASSSSCPVIVDPLGTTLTLNHGERPTASLAPTSVAVETWLVYFHRADFLILSDAASTRIPLTPVIADYVTDNFDQIDITGARIFERKGYHPDTTLAPPVP